jgi:hypothetical protein
MEYALISAAALVVAALTFFSGFGLGTLLMPVFALFFPIELAVAATAVVHLANNLFKAALIGRKADLKVVARFAIPAAAFAVLGALLLVYVSDAPPLIEYHLGTRPCTVTTVKIVIAALILAFAAFELVPFLRRFSLGPRYVPFGGAISGFFGGLSGHQGALRTAFLMRLGLSKEAFIGTVVLSAVVVDIFRLAVYGVTFLPRDLESMPTGSAKGLVLAGVLSAFAGSFIGARFLKKLTMQTIQIIVGTLLVLLALGLGLGVI